MDRRKFIITTAGIAGGIGVYTYSTTPKLSVASPKPVETPNIPNPLNTNQYFDIPINPFEIQGENLSTSSDITIEYEIRRASDDSSVSTATESVNVTSSGSFTVNTQGRQLRLRNSDISGGSEDFYIHITISHPDTGSLDAQSAGFTVKESGSYLNVSITGSSSPVDEGSTLTVDYEVENTGTESDTQTIKLDVAGSQRDSRSETVGSGNTAIGSLSWNTSTGDAGDYTATVSSSETSDSVSVSVESATVTRSEAIAAADAWYDPVSGGKFEQKVQDAPSNYPDTFSSEDFTYVADRFGDGLDAILAGTGNAIQDQTEIYSSGNVPDSITTAQYIKTTPEASSSLVGMGLQTADDQYIYGVGEQITGRSEVALWSQFGNETAGVEGSTGAIGFISIDNTDPSNAVWQLSGPQLNTVSLTETMGNLFINTSYSENGELSEFAVCETDTLPSAVVNYFKSNY